MRRVWTTGLVAIVAGLARPAQADPNAHQVLADWELSVHATLLEDLDPALACGVATFPHPPPPWVHLTLQVAPDGTRTGLRLDGPRVHRPLQRCLEESLPSALPPHDDDAPRVAVRTLFFLDGLVEEGFPGPQRLRLPVLLGGRPERGVAGMTLDDLVDEESDVVETPRLQETSFVLSPDDALADLRRRLWLQALRNELEDRSKALAACGFAGRLAIGLDGAGLPALREPDDPCVAELVAGLRLHASPDGTPGRLALQFADGTFQRAEWPGDQDVLLSEEDETMVMLTRNRAGPATSECYSRGISQPFQKVWGGQLVVGVIVGSAGEVSDVLTAGELAGGPFARCVKEAHEPLGFPAPKDGVPVLLLVRYVFAVNDPTAAPLPGASASGQAPKSVSEPGPQGPGRNPPEE